MKTINDFFSEFPSKNLYHYTSIDSLLGISNSNSLWASNINHLNDSKEIQLACETFKRVLDKKIEENSGAALSFLSNYEQWLNLVKVTPHNLFVFSLSEKKSLLSQWRSYTPFGKGVSLGFSPSILKSIINDNNIKIAKCLYKKNEQEELIDSLLNKLIISIDQKKPYENISKNSNISQKCQEFLNNYIEEILQVFSIIKHDAFEEEKEWRLISKYYENYKSPQINYRLGASMLTPYIELKIKKKPYFEKVILGPSQHLNLTHNTLSQFLSNKKLCSNLRSSNIPYRQW